MKTWTYEEINEIPEHSMILNGKEVEIIAGSVKHSKWTSKLNYKMEKLYNKKPLLMLSADIVLVSKEKLRDISDEILEISPDLVIEIEKEREEVDIDEKINYYSSIGIKKQLWILLSKREILVIEDNERTIYRFDDEVELLEGKKIKFSDIEKEVFE